jgi:hypothetical protein
MLAMSTGCAPSADAVRLAPLPPPPAFVAPVPVPSVAAGDDVRIIAARHRAALVQANARLRDTRAWYLRLGR